MSKSKIMVLTALMMVALSTIIISSAVADEGIKAKGRTVTHITKQEVSEVGDVPSHLVGIAEFKGLAFYDGGEVATCTGVFRFDLIKGNGTYQAYMLNTFDDGSTKVFKGEGTAKVIEGVRSFTGTYAITGGSGRFEGIEGTCQHTGKRRAGVAGYSDFTETYTLASQ